MTLGSRIARAGLGLCLLMWTGLPLSSTGFADELPETLWTSAGHLKVDVAVNGLNYPWSLVFLPSGEMLVSEKHPGRLRLISENGKISPPIEGLPENIYAKGNGGLLGLALDPDFHENKLVYFAFAEQADDDPEKAALSVGRGKLGKDRLSDVEIIFRQGPKINDDREFGGRLAFAPDGTLFVMTGDRYQHELVHDTGNTLGKLIRINRDGSVPEDNPFVGKTGYDPRIYSLGHRNIGGGIIHPETGKLWLEEFGPIGGDEINVIEPGKDYGWPVVNWGVHYFREDIPDPPTRPDLAQPIYFWNPSISPSGMTYYTGDEIPGWKGSLVVGGLASQSATRLTLQGERVISDERMEFGVRIRDVAQGPEGALYLLTDERAPDGRILRLTLEKPVAETKAASTLKKAPPQP